MHFSVVIGRNKCGSKTTQQIKLSKLFINETIVCFYKNETLEGTDKKKEDRKKVGENVPGTQFRGAHTALLALILCAYFIISSEEMLPGKEKHYMYNEFHWH